MVLASVAFVREHLRAPLTLVLLVAIPALFVIASAAVLGEFASALGGAVEGASASALGAGWSAAFLAGALGYFQVSSSRDADRRLALAGLGPGTVAAARIGASLVLALVVSAAAFLTLELRQPPVHPAHAAAGVITFAVIYVGIGTLIGSFISEPLEGSLTVALVFLERIRSGARAARRRACRSAGSRGSAPRRRRPLRPSHRGPDSGGSAARARRGRRARRRAPSGTGGKSTRSGRSPPLRGAGPRQPFRSLRFQVSSDATPTPNEAATVQPRAGNRTSTI